MRFPSRAEELELHERILQKEPVASADAFQAFMEPISKVLQDETGCSTDDAHDSALDALLSYLRQPERYELARARLSTYLTQAAKKKAMDRRRSSEARTRREVEFAGVFELQARTPKEVLEVSVEARLAVERLDSARLNARERDFLRLVLQGERSTRNLAEVLDLASLPEDALRKEVKRHRDRLMKVLERLGREEPDDES